MSAMVASHPGCTALSILSSFNPHTSTPINQDIESWLASLRSDSQRPRRDPLMHHLADPYSLPYTNPRAVNSRQYESYRESSRPTVTEDKYAAYPSTYNPAQTRHGHSSTNPEHKIASFLQLPSSIDAGKGSLAEFAAEMTCLFWFESAGLLTYAEGLTENETTDRAISKDVLPSIGFTKWMTTILSTTQVARNVVLLALLFIYRLKKYSPAVSGMKGSEFRLLTIALMLGNKYLDDNTYTNKTWAEVSGISVGEIHIMEVEFLSNMRYELYVSKDQWKKWESTLARLKIFYDKAVKPHRTECVSPVAAGTLTGYPKFTSPTSTGRNYPSWAQLPNPIATIPQLPQSPARSHNSQDQYYTRKRSLDVSHEMPPTKRVHHVSIPSAPHPLSVTPQSLPTPNSMSSVGSHEGARNQQLLLPHHANLPQRSNIQLAPLALPGSRAMSSVYSSYNHQTPVTPTTQGPSTIFPTNQAFNFSYPNTSARTSPTNLHGFTTPTRLSPSYLLANRDSPYRPVHRVNTLLQPPPDAATLAPAREIQSEQIHYQPLSKTLNDIRTGPLPHSHYSTWHYPDTASVPCQQLVHQY